MKFKSKLVPLALLALGHGALAQQIPGAGIQLQQLPPTPALPRAAPKIRIEQTTAPPAPGAAAVTVLVTALEITGAKRFSTTDLLQVAQFTPGTQYTLSELQAMAARISGYYRIQGYFIAQAYLPAQDVSAHVVNIVVSEGKFGKVIVRNHSRLSDAMANDLLRGLDSGQAITIAPLENRLLLLSDVPGVKVTSTLVPGTLPGSSDLLVDIVPGRRVTGLVEADNAGNPYTGENRLGASVSFNNLFGHADVLTVRALSSGQGLNYGRASYQRWFGRATAGVAYSRLYYELGKQFKPLGAHGTAEIASLFGALPLQRSRNSNLYVGLTLEDRHFFDQMDLFPAADRKAQISAATLSLYGNRRDNFGRGGSSSFYLALTAGKLDIQTPAARAADAIGAHSNGSYQKLWFNATREQQITDRFSLAGTVTGQLASGNLDPSEKMVLGGMDGVRAYPQGEAFGDEGVLLNLEARLRLAQLSGRIPGQVSLVGFVDTARISIDKDPWFAGDNERTLSGAGLGLVWNEPGNYLVRMYYARKLGNELAQSAPDQSGRFWIQAVKYF